MPKSPEQPTFLETKSETKLDKDFLQRLEALEREVGGIDTSRGSTLDRNAQHDALKIVGEISKAETNNTKRRELLLELGRQVSQIDASSTKIDRDLKRTALILIEELKDRFKD